MTLDTALFLVCRQCRKPFAAEHGHTEIHCSEACATPMIDMPDDDDGYDGLPFDPDSRVHHCVFPRPNADLSVLPEDWAQNAKSYPYGCCCGHSHEVLSREDVRKYRLAGFEVTTESSCNDTHDYSDDRWEDDCDYGTYNDYWPVRTYSPREWLEGLSFDNADDRSAQAWEYSRLSDMLSDEFEVLGELGFKHPTGVPEVVSGEPVRPLPPVAAPIRQADVTMVGVYRVRRATPAEGEGVRGDYVIEHAHGGLVPEIFGGYEKVRLFWERSTAVTEANRLWNDLLHPEHRYTQIGRAHV